MRFIYNFVLYLYIVTLTFEYSYSYYLQLNDIIYKGEDIWTKYRKSLHYLEQPGLK